MKKNRNAFTLTVFSFLSLLFCNGVYHTLISTSTPEGNSNFIKASIVLEEEL